MGSFVFWSPAWVCTSGTLGTARDLAVFWRWKGKPLACHPSLLMWGFIKSKPNQVTPLLKALEWLLHLSPKRQSPVTHSYIRPGSRCLCDFLSHRSPCSHHLAQSALCCFFSISPFIAVSSACNPCPPDPHNGLSPFHQKFQMLRSLLLLNTWVTALSKMSIVTPVFIPSVVPCDSSGTLLFGTLWVSYLLNWIHLFT
jgi:hypothetical protein